MKLENARDNYGSVLLVALLTITIMMLICATSLYITSQNTGSGMQTAGWQQSLTAAESGVDAAIRALNEDAQGYPTSAWANWIQLAQSGTSLPSAEPSPASGSTPTGPPPATGYYYLLPSSQLTNASSNSEGALSTSAWVTIDQAGGMGATPAWYRVRSSGQTIYPSNGVLISRVSNNRLDNDLRNSFALHFNRNGGSLGPSRKIEVILSPVSNGSWARAITMKNGIQVSGSGSIDSFNSSSVPSPHQWALAYRDNPGQAQVGIVNNTTNSDLRSTYLYGSLTYSGPAVKNTSNVKGNISTPFSAGVTSTVDPTSASWAQTDSLQQYSSSQQQSIPTFGGGNFTSYGGGGSMPNTLGNPAGNPAATFTSTGTQASPTLIKVGGDFTVSGSSQFYIANGAAGTSYAIIWVTGKFTTSGSATINQDPNVKVTWIVDNDITVSGSSFNNQSGLAANLEFIGVGSNHNITDSGSATFTGTINAPGDNITISGSGDFTGAAIGNTLTISGSASFHYDDALSLNGSSGTIGNFAFASWFEDNSAPKHKDVNGNYVIY